MTDPLFVSSARTNMVELRNNGKEILIISPDGRITWNGEQSDAALAFWRVVESWRPPSFEVIARLEADMLVLATENGRLTKELRVTEDLLAERQRVLDAVPPCPMHGACVPHAIAWIKGVIGDKTRVEA